MNTTQANGTPPMAPEIAALHQKIDMIGQAFNQLAGAVQELLRTRPVCGPCYIDYVQAQRRNEQLLTRGEDELPLPPLNAAGAIVNGDALCLNHTVVGVPGQTPAGLIIATR